MHTSICVFGAVVWSKFQLKETEAAAALDASVYANDAFT